jgi:hypothetical protein
VDLVPTIIGWVRLWGQDNGRFANLWGWTLGFTLHCLNIYASYLLKVPALINVQLGGVVLSFIWLGLIIRLRIKHNEPVGLPFWLVLKLIQRIKKYFQERRQKKGLITKHTTRRYRLFTFKRK